MNDVKIEKTKVCQNCGATVPEELNFCPYCMDKFVYEEDKNNKIEIKHSRKKFAIIIVITLMAVIVGTIIYFSIINNEKSNDNVDNSNSSNIDYSNYIGTWQSDYIEANKSFYETGGISLRIIKIKDGLVTFDLISVSESSDIAEIYDLTANIKENEAMFYYDNDGQSNAGKGTLEFKDNAIKIIVDTTESSDNATWDLSADEKLVRRPTPHYNLVDIIGNSFGVIRDDISNGVPSELPKNDEFDSDITIYEYPEINVSTSNDNITGTFVDYTKIDDMTAYSIMEKIDGNATYDELEKQLGPPESTQKEDKLFVVGYWIDEEKDIYVKFYFKENSQIKTIQKVHCFLDGIY